MAEGFKSGKGPAGLASPRWSCSYEDVLGRTIAETRPGFRGALLVTSTEYNTATHLVATCTYVLNENSTPTWSLPKKSNRKLTSPNE